MADMQFPGPGSPVRLVDDSGSAVDVAQQPPDVTSVSRLAASAASTNATVISTEPGYVYHINGTNAAATRNYLKLYDKATTPSEADTPLITFALAVTSVFSFNLPPLLFSTGISYRLVSGAADNSTTAVSLNDVVALNIVYRSA